MKGINVNVSVPAEVKLLLERLNHKLDLLHGAWLDGARTGLLGALLVCVILYLLFQALRK